MKPKLSDEQKAEAAERVRSMVKGSLTREVLSTARKYFELLKEGTDDKELINELKELIDNKEKDLFPGTE